MQDEIVLLYTTWPDAETARHFAAHAVSSGLCACANLMAPHEAIYRWEGRIENAREHAMILKTTRAASPALIEAMAAAHPHEVPAAVALSVDAGASSAGFLAWVREQSPGI